MDRYGLIGYPLGHSFSKRFFAEKFKREGIDAVYENYEISEAGMLLDVVRQNPELRGLNCTIPHKQAIIPLLDSVSDEAREIGAVNVIRILRNADGSTKLEGHNTDCIGFEESIKLLLTIRHHNALVFGTGGASRAICYSLTRLGLEWKLVSRSPRPGMLTYQDLAPEVIRQHTVIVNCSPVGMSPHTDEAPQMDYDALTPDHLLYDLIYNPEETLFLKHGWEHGCTTKNGQEMLELQAKASWEIWNNK